MLAKLKNFEPLFNSYSTIFGLKSFYLGAFLALATLIQPNSGICGLIALLICYTFLSFLSSHSNSSFTNSALRNSLLIGLVIGNLFSINFHILALLLIVVFLTIIVTAALEKLFQNNNLPILSLPFFISALTIFILNPEIYKFSTLPQHFLAPDIISFLPNFSLQFFHALSSVLCFTNPLFGMLFFIAILLTSPLSALFLFIGFSIGNYAESFFRTQTQELSLYSESYNYSLVFALVGGIFMTPSKLSIFFASIMTIITAIIVTVASKILNPWFLPILSFPFILVTLSFLLALKIINPTKLNKLFFATPEDNLENYYTLQKRHKFGEIGLFLPVAGRWQIQQAFDGDITHKGFWKYALDFVTLDENNKIIKNKGLNLEDHLSFAKDVLSPIDGVVTSCIYNEKDNKIAEVETSRNWGNYIIIKSSYGFFVKLSHLKQNSLIVKIGDFVSAGQKIAECGNSGYSQEPHLHLQVQYQGEVGAKTIPFHLVNFISNNKVYFHRTPIKNEILESINFNQSTLKALNFIIDDKMFFKKSDNSIVEITSEINEETGEFCLNDGTSKLHHFRIGSQFYFYNLKTKKVSALYHLFCAAPRIPLSYGQDLEYSDNIAFSLKNKKLTRFYNNLLLILGFDPKKKEGQYKINKQGLEISGNIDGNLTYFKIDPLLGIEEFRYGEEKYVRVNQKN